jgi:hypothetical protein
MTSKAMENPVSSLLADEVPEGSWIFGFDAMKEENEELVFLCDDDATKEWVQHVERPFWLYTWSARRIMMTNKDTKETLPAVRVVLVDADRETMSFVSVGAVASLDLIRTLRGDGPYDKPIPVIVKQVKTGNGFHTYKLKVLPKNDPLCAVQ